MHAARLRFRPPALLPAMLFMLVVLPLLSACGYNTIPTAEENAKAAWSEVLNQYQRRADLIPNLVETVKGYAAHEKDMLEGVVEARAKATQMTVPPETLTDPEAFKKFQDSQSGLTSALSQAARRGRELSRPQGQPELPGAAGAARRHGKPHRGGAARLHRGGRASTTRR